MMSVHAEQRTLALRRMLLDFASELGHLQPLALAASLVERGDVAEGLVAHGGGHYDEADGSMAEEQ
jgi:hypothetical protein